MREKALKTKDFLPSKLNQVLSEFKQNLQDYYQNRLHRLVLFGSYARQQATTDSDIDVLIVLNGSVNASTEINQTGALVARLCLENDVLISRLFLSAARYEEENSPLLRNIRQEGVLL